MSLDYIRIISTYGNIQRLKRIGSAEMENYQIENYWMAMVKIVLSGALSPLSGSRLISGAWGSACFLHLLGRSIFCYLSFKEILWDST